MYTHLKRKEAKKREESYDLVKLLCTFVNYGMAKEYFTPPETTENTGFAEDLKNMAPGLDLSKYEEYLEDRP